MATVPIIIAIQIMMVVLRTTMKSRTTMTTSTTITRMTMIGFRDSLLSELQLALARPAPNPELGAAAAAALALHNSLTLVQMQHYYKVCTQLLCQSGLTVHFSHRTIGPGAQFTKTQLSALKNRTFVLVYWLEAHVCIMFSSYIAV